MIKARRDTIRAFSIEMERKLQKHDATKGVIGWRETPVEFLLNKLKGEVIELEQCIKMGRKADSILGAAVDASNFAMMIADTAGRLNVKKPSAFPVEDCERHRVVIDGENFYLTVGRTFVEATVPFENTNDREKLRRIVKELTNAITRAMGGEVLEDEV